MDRRTFLKQASAAGLAVVGTPAGLFAARRAADARPDLSEAFLRPPAAAKPQVFWYWMNGNVTRDGITRDLEAMARVGIGGVVNFDGGTLIPKGPVVYLSPEWLELKIHAIREAERLGLEFAMHNCPGWSSSGGPWITPELGMQQLVWTETTVAGGTRVKAALPRPTERFGYYHDVAAIAFPAAPGGAPRIADWQKKANVAFGVDGVAASSDATPSGIAPGAIVDLTARMDAAGVLDWDAPAGKWTVMRFGHTAMGTQNRSAPDTGVGLECDKYSKAAIEFHFDRMMQRLLPVLAPLAAHGQAGLVIDSYEVGMQNWTADFPAEFRSRRGYDLLPWLPAMAGLGVGSAERSDRFLWDLRRTQADLLADNYYGHFAELCHRHGIAAWAEPYDRGPMEELQVGARVDVNAGEFWFGLSSIFQNNKTMRRTPKLAASIAHASGKRIVAAESFTGEPESGRWQEHPFAMKPLGDRIFSEGVNRIAFHRYAHQPHPDAAPGMTMGPWGMHFERTNTWWEQGREYLSYLSRCQALLQHGVFAADLAYVAEEDANRYTKVTRDELDPPAPEGYDYDVVNAETVVNRMSADPRGTSRAVLPDGMSYRVLVLQHRGGIGLVLLRKLRELVQGGLVIVGRRPGRSPGLQGGRGDDEEVRRIAAEMWGDIDGGAVTEHRFGKGRVVWGQALAAVLASLDLPPDFESSSRSGDAPLVFIHRRSAGNDPEADVYFVSNQRRSREEVVCTFRVSGRQPEAWDPVTGAQAPLDVWQAGGGRTRVPLVLGPSGSMFVVFRSPAAPRATAIDRGGTTLIGTRPFPARARARHERVASTFTIALWAKPENSVMLSTAGFMEHVLDPWTDGYAIYPPPGETLYGAGHATCGLAIGRNGVAVWEHASRVPVFGFAAPAALAGWTHVALVYRDGVPSIYVNGALAGRGTRSPSNRPPGRRRGVPPRGGVVLPGRYDRTAPVRGGARRGAASGAYGRTAAIGAPDAGGGAGDRQRALARAVLGGRHVPRAAAAGDRCRGRERRRPNRRRRGAMGSSLPSGPRRAGARHAARPRVPAPPREPGRAVLFRDSDVVRRLLSRTGVQPVRTRRAHLPGPRAGRGDRARAGERDRSRHAVDTAVPCGRHRRAADCHQPPRGRGDQPLAEPADRRRAIPGSRHVRDRRSGRTLLGAEQRGNPAAARLVRARHAEAGGRPGDLRHVEALHEGLAAARVGPGRTGHDLARCRRVLLDRDLERPHGQAAPVREVAQRAGAPAEAHPRRRRLTGHRRDDHPVRSTAARA